MNKKTLNIIVTVEYILLALSFIANLYGFNSAPGNLQYLCNLCAVIFALVYLVFGCKKEGSLFFKIFMWFLVFKEGYAITAIAVNEKVPAVAFVMVLICFALSAILAVSLNLGKTRSFCFAGAHMLFSALCLIFSAFGGFSDVIIFNATRLLLSTVCAVLIYAKYADKAARGAK